jgi:uncharacterized protein (TIGR02466 family)
MNVMKYDMFPTLVVGFTDFITNEQRKDIVDYLTNEEFVSHKALLSNKGTSTFHTGQKLLESLENNVSSCKDLKSKIGRMIHDYSITSGFSFNEIGNSWANIQNVGSVLDEHAHPLSVISGALYLNVDDLSSSLYFQNPNPYLDYTKTIEETQYSYHWTQIKPQNGLLLLFPSWLKHGSNGEMNQTEKRIVLSFNAI